MDAYDTPLKQAAAALTGQRHERDLRQQLANEKQLTSKLRQQLVMAGTQRAQVDLRLKKLGERL